MQTSGDLQSAVRVHDCPRSLGVCAAGAVSSSSSPLQATTAALLHNAMPKSENKDVLLIRMPPKSATLFPREWRGAASYKHARPFSKPASRGILRRMSHVASAHRYEGMHYRHSGRSGLKLPAISLGLWHNFGGVDAYETARSMLLRAFDLGITHFDLANNYGPPPGSAEETCGRVLKQDLHGHRDEL